MAQLGGYLPATWVWPNKAAADVSADIQRAFGLITCLICLFLLPIPMFLILCGPIYCAGTYIPIFLQQGSADRRAIALENELPQLAEMMAIMVSAGLGVSQALPHAAETVRDPLQACFKEMSGQIELGLSRSSALTHMASKHSSRDMERFAAVIVDAERLGTPLGETLNALAAELRDKKIARIREKAQKAPILMLFPLVFLILPSFLLLSVGPAVVSQISPMLY